MEFGAARRESRIHRQYPFRKSWQHLDIEPGA